MGDDPARLYRLDGVAHIAGVINDELLGVVPPPSQVQKYAVNCSWFQDTFGECPEGADDETVRRYARAYIMMLLGTQLFADKSGNRIHIRWLPYVVRLEEMDTYSWGSAALTWLYRCMCRVANRHVVKLAGPLQLLQSWIFWRFPQFRLAGYETFSWPLASRWSGYNPSGSEKGHRVQMWRLRIDQLQDREVIYLDAVKQSRRTSGYASRGFGASAYGVVAVSAFESRPEHRLSDVEGWQRRRSMVPVPFAEVASLLGLRAETVLRFDVVADPGPSHEFLEWWSQHGKRFLSPEMHLGDPRAVPIPVEASQRGAGRVPDMDRPEDVPDRWRLERRARVGTRQSQREWRWLDVAIDDDDDASPARGGRRGQGGRRRGRGAADHRGRDPDDDQHGPVGGDGAGTVAVDGVSTHDGGHGGEWYGSGMGDGADHGDAGLGSGPLGDYFVGVPAHDQPQQEGTPWVIPGSQWSDFLASDTLDADFGGAQFLEDITVIMQEDVPARRRGQTSGTQAPLDFDLNEPPTAFVGDHFGLGGTPPSAYAAASESIAGPSAAPVHFTPPAQPGPDEDADEIEDEEPFIRRGQRARVPVVALRARICLDESCFIYFVP
ncbi:hypothetical protein Ahy_A08g038777 [Arachis hypogaea]|uniref:Aminotransferase-like plant mobile domain-containing protein n=1 Tax=Arachis hypogaea TaxID=3818 RepID=A0A445BUP4_ARAHY|nr:hypothetical protein Ahy_A08g038777 [Arachis hypogaea]